MCGEQPFTMTLLLLFGQQSPNTRNLCKCKAVQLYSRVLAWSMQLENASDMNKTGLLRLTKYALRSDFCKLHGWNTCSATAEGSVQSS